jgi:flagellar biosynthesis/type III secretory pathway protein FliH
LKSAIRNPQSAIKTASQELTRLCGLVKSLADQLGKLHEETIANHRGDIARLAVEISRKILAQRVANGDYDVQSVIEEALKRAPTHQNIVVRVNPQDLPACQKLRQEDNADGPFAQLEFVADRSIARADCLVETPKGIIQSFVEQHLKRISEALGKAE